MEKRVLILDDDEDFNALLTDIFDQASYQVVARSSPSAALKAFQEGRFDVVISDQQMPDMPGSEFMAEIHKMNPKVPVIMVSGYLDNDTIRDLIRDGVAGVFLKPLNIMALLERSDELIAEAKRHDEEASTADAFLSASTRNLGFRFRSFPCRSEVSTAFARKLYDYRRFKASLTLVGERGTHFRAICEDIAAMSGNDIERCVFLNASSTNPEYISGMVRNAMKDSVGRVNFVAMDLESYAPAEIQTLVQLARRDNEYNSSALEIRLIVCLTQSVDSLYEEGKIPDALYFALGTTEVTVPPLRECREDLPVLAQQFIVDIVKERGWPSVPRLRGDVQKWLMQQPWSGNAIELREVMRRALAKAGNVEIQLEHITAAMAGDTGIALKDELMGQLNLGRREFVAAFGRLLNNDSDRISEALGAPASQIEPYLR